MKVLDVGRSKNNYKHYPQHQHGCWEILLCLTGSGTLTAEDQTYSFIPGSIFIFPPYMIHSTDSLKGISDISMNIHDFRPIGGQHFHHFIDDQLGSIRKIMELAYYYNQLNTPYSRACVNTMGDLIYQICVCYYNQTLTSDLRLETIIDLIQNSFSDPNFDLSIAIENTGYHKDHFRRIFKKATGYTPVAYLTQLRISYAKSLFTQFGTSRPIQDIALASGFSDPLYFSRIFHKTTGMSPTEFIHKCYRKTGDKSAILLNSPLDWHSLH